ncbi:hypothetical protein B0I35DRAFT_404824 [Stachybotrys elegans]|uniref:FAD-binding domain-containing protein n=1 Tax=Stachybotrys elegans TaxID=80388 RepID=A0A8K0T3R5_9HYPO|nr:hypothetical protein B0I35DRAFT_404824 [Stachybotrys elegans]
MIQNFKVIVVGGGPSGLITAHALHQANIDFVVLERRTAILEDVGASLILDPTSLRVLSQLGLWDELERAGTELKRVQSFTKDGRLFKDSSANILIHECHGSSFRAFHRADLVKILYDGLAPSAKEKVLSGKGVVEIDQSEDSVNVVCSDGATYIGSIVIGADGVHSQTRRQMRKAVLKKNPTAKWDDEFPFIATYRCLWGNFPTPAATPPGYASETHHQDRSIMYVAGKKRGWIFVYEKLPAPTNRRAVYTIDDMEALASGLADWPVSETLTLGDVFDKSRAGMSDLQEGLVDNLSNGRLVLVGDSGHKFTPNSGLGLNSGIQDVTAICNGINAAISESADGHPDAATLERVFKSYREARHGPLEVALSRSMDTTRTHAWASTWYYLLSQYLITPFVEHVLYRYLVSRSLRAALVLDYVSGEEPFKGFLSWFNPIRPVKK